jgi:hypothetical protein
MNNLRPIIYSVLCASAIGYLFGVVFAARAIQMSDLQHDLREMIVLSGWVGATFGALYILVGLAALGAIGLFRLARSASLSRGTRIYLLSWIALGTAIGIPFLGYYYSSGLDPHSLQGAHSAWDLLPYWLIRVGRWISFSALAAAVLSFVTTWAMLRFFRIRETGEPKLWSAPLLIGVPLIIVFTWLAPPVYLWLDHRRHDPVETPVAVPDIVPGEALAPLVVVGWDGATWDVIDPLLAKRRLPNLESLIDRGLRASLQSYEPTSSPLIWTTISTGRPPGQHGVRSQVENRFQGMHSWFFFPPGMGFDRVFGRFWEELGIADRIQITSHARRVKAFWNILDDAGRSVGLINWQVSWPVEAFRGFNVTPRIHPFLRRILDDSGAIPAHVTDAALREAAPDASHPPVERERLQRCLRATADRADGFAKACGLARDLVPEHELFALDVGLSYLAESAVDVLGVYFYEVDGIEHTYWKYREPRYFFGVSKTGIQRWGETIDDIYAFTDLMLGEVLARIPDEAIVLLLSDHGHGPVFGEFRRSGGHAHAPPGILVIAGPGVERGATLRDPGVYDIFPTLMWLSGLPIERAARGRVLLEAFQDGVVERRPVRAIEAYAPREAGTRSGDRTSPVDPELIRRLRALGYVG